MADYGGTYNDPTLGFYGGMADPNAPPPYLPLGQTDQPFNDITQQDTVTGSSAAGSAPPPAPTNPFGPDPITNAQPFGPTAAGQFTPPSGVPDPQYPGYDTTGYLIGSTYDPNTGTLTIKRPDGSTAVTQINPKTGAIDTSKATPKSPFGTVINAAPPPPPQTPGTGIYNPSFYTPFTTPAPIFQRPPAFRAPTLQEAEDYPGYKFGVQQGEQALQQSAAAKGLLRTGGTLKGILDYGRNAATQNYGNVLGQQLGIYNTNLGTQYQQPFENAFATFIAEQNRFQQNQTNPFTKYLDLIKAANPNV